eukprot:gene3991-7247_t
MTVEEKKIRLEKEFKENDQHQVFQFWSELKEEEKKHLISDLENVDLKELKNYFDTSLETLNSNKNQKFQIEPLNDKNVANVLNFTQEEHSEIEKIGLEAILAGKVGLLLVAGGQGTRLGSSLPKGMYDIGLPSHSTLFKIQAERFQKFQKLTTKKLFWYVMTSFFTYEETKQYFEKENFFGIPKDQIIIFQQGKLPCLDVNGKILLESKSHVSFAPNGNGGMYSALEDEGVLKHMKDNSIEFIQIYCVDNVLIKILDPIFIGNCIKNKSDFSTKVIPKRSWDEKVGVYAFKNSNLSVVEYSEISEEMAKKVNQNNDLLFNHANIVIFMFSLEFLSECATYTKKQPEYHIAKKKIGHINENGDYVHPEKENGYKLELFNFDICKYSKSPSFLLVDRNYEFSPLKNSSGSPKDSPETCCQDLYFTNIQLLKSLGFKIKNEQGGICEISPLFDLTTLDKEKEIELPIWLK